jgi:hypothetical protein
MARAIYPKYKEAILNGGANVDLVAGNVKVALVDTGAYTYSAAHQFLSSLTGVVGTAISVPATKTVTNGTFATSASTGTFTAVTGATVEALVYYIDTGTAGTSRLVYYDDAATGLVLTPNGADVTITFPGAGIFTI